MTTPLDPALLAETAADLYENAPCGYLSTLPDGTILKVNETFLAWTGYERGAVVGARRFQQLLSMAGRIYHQTHLTPLLLTEGEALEVALELVCADGRRLPILVNWVQVRDEDGKARVHRLTVFNAQQRRAYELELLAERRRAEDAARIKADFLSMISHEIRTPLGAIMGVTHLLERASPNAQQARLLRIQRSSSENLLNLVNEVLDFSKIEAGQVALDPKPFSLRDLIYETASRLEVQTSTGVALLAEVDDEIPPCLEGDAGKIGQVLVNLVGNAIKFTKEGQVCVAARLCAQTDAQCTVEISVTDTGIGIPLDRQETIFEAFTQASVDTSVRYGGTGLGLAISQSLLGLHGTAMTVDSAPGRGARFAFSLSLPLAEALPADVEQPQLVGRVRGMRVLVAEDNPINVYVISRCLEDWGVDFDVVGDGRQAVERVRAVKYDLVLMDLTMPEMDGYEATRAIRSVPEPRFADLPIIALSASTRIGQQDRVSLAGFTEFLGKPYQPSTLLARIARYADASHAATPAPETATADALAGFSVEHLRARSDDDATAVDLFADVRATLEALRDRLGRALQAGDLARYTLHARQGQAAVDLLQASTLHAAITRGRRLLAEGGSPADLAAVARAIEWAVDDIVTTMTLAAR